MRYANPAYLKAALDKVQKEVTSVESLVSELQELKAKGLLKDPSEESYISQLRRKTMKDEDEEARTAKFLDQDEVDEMRKELDYFDDLENELIYGHNIGKEEELENLLKWVKEDAIDQKAHGAVVLDGDHVYPLPVELF